MCLLKYALDSKAEIPDSSGMRAAHFLKECGMEIVDVGARHGRLTEIPLPLPET